MGQQKAGKNRLKVAFESQELVGLLLGRGIVLSVRSWSCAAACLPSCAAFVALHHAVLLHALVSASKVPFHMFAQHNHGSWSCLISLPCRLWKTQGSEWPSGSHVERSECESW